MGTGWRRAFCTTVPRDRKERERRDNTNIATTTTTTHSLISTTTPQLLRCKTTNSSSIIDGADLLVTSPPKLQCKTSSNTPKCSMTKNSPRTTTILGSYSNSSSPRSPFAILKNTLRLSKSSCGVCTQSVKTCQGMAIYTGSCSHTFHFPCIASHVRKHRSLICPVCNATWKDVPLLAFYAQNQTRDDTTVRVDPIDTPTKHTPLPSPKYTKHCQVTKSYADDEPLVTPKASPRVVHTIPEETVKDDEEFQGFFVNPVSSSDDAFAFDMSSRNVEVSLLPEAAVISQGQTHDTYAFVLKVKAPRVPVCNRDTSSRAPIDLVAVLDVSGSMSGAKLEMLKRAMRLVISSLGPADRLSVVAFSASPKRMLPLKRMTAHGQHSARRIVDRLGCSQGTSMAEALKEATRVLEERREKNPVATIILLSDGQGDTVPTNNENSQRRGSSHTRFAHVEIREPAEDAFTKCVGGLLSVVVQDLRIQLSFAAGSDPAEITAVYTCHERPMVLGSSHIRLGDLYAEEEKELLVEMRVPASNFGSHHVLSVKYCYKDPSTCELVYSRDHALLVPRPQSVRPGLPRIERLRDAFINIRAVAESRRLIENNELYSAMQLLSSARALLLQSRSESACEYVRGLEAELAEVQWRRQCQQQIGCYVDDNGEPCTPTSARRAADKLGKVAQMKKYLNRTGDLHGLENARF